MKYEYKHITIPFSEDQLLLIGLPLPAEQRMPLDTILEEALNKEGSEGWRVVSPLILPTVLLERKVQKDDD